LGEASDTPEQRDLREAEAVWLDYSGFAEYRLGYRLHDTDLHGQRYIDEGRLHLEGEHRGDGWRLDGAVDLLHDGLEADSEIDLETGEGWLILRKLSLFTQLGSNLDLTAGRQVLTWGTGDLLFLNDLFPKGWRYWLGRDIDYIKAPSDALKLSWFHPWANLDLVYAPRFVSSIHPTGERISLFNENLNRRIGVADAIATDRPDRWFEDDELAARLYRRLGSAELALYGFKGFFKGPYGYNPERDHFFYPELSSLGASLRTPLGPGILSLEGARWYSDQDRAGDDPFIDNGETRWLIGYQWEAAPDFTVGVQYYAEHMSDYGDYRRTLPEGMVYDNRVDELFSLRLNYTLMQQKLTLCLFSYYSPQGNDIYLRPEIRYEVDDAWTLEAGGTWFDGDHANGYFGQYRENSNLYLAVRYNFVGGHR
jgi:hypothetical protein